MDVDSDAELQDLRNKGYGVITADNIDINKGIKLKLVFAGVKITFNNQEIVISRPVYRQLSQNEIAEIEEQEQEDMKKIIGNKPS